MGSVRYSWAPLEPYVGSDNDAASLLRVARRTVLRYKAEGLTLDQAERAADAVGEHPFILWPEMRDELIAGLERPCGAEDCDETFLPYRPQHTYCSPRCKKRTEMRRYRQRPDVQERRKESNRRYYEACRDYLRARQRVYDRANRERLTEAKRRRREEQRRQRLQGGVLQGPPASSVATTSAVSSRSEPSSARSGPETVSHPSRTMEPREEAA